MARFIVWRIFVKILNADEKDLKNKEDAQGNIDNHLHPPIWASSSFPDE
jgi:hypothetical protein